MNSVKLLLSVSVVVLDVGFQVISSVILVVTEFAFEETDFAVSGFDVSDQLELVRQNFAALFTLDFYGFFVGSSFLLCHSAKPLMRRDPFHLNATVGASYKLRFTVFILHVLLQTEHRLEAHLALDLFCCVRQHVSLQDVFVGE